MEMVKKSMRDSEAATGKYVPKERDDKSKGKEKDDQTMPVHKEAIKAHLNASTTSSISSSSSTSSSQPLPSRDIKGPLSKDTQDKKQKEKSSKDRLFWMHDHPAFTPSFTSSSTSTPNVSDPSHTNASSSTSANSSNAKSDQEIRKEWYSLLEEIQAKLGYSAIHNLADGIYLQGQIKDYIAKIKLYEKHQSISRGSIEQALSQLKSLSVEVEDALDKVRYNAVIDEINQVLDTRVETINRIQDEEEDPAIIIATAREIKPHVEAAIKRLEEFSTKQNKGPSIKNLKEAKSQLEAIIRDYSHRKILLDKYKAAFRQAAEHISKRIEQEQEELAKSVGKPVGKPKITITNKPGITIAQLEEMFGDDQSNTCDLQKLLGTLDISVNFPAAEETSSDREEGASTKETKREEIRRGKEREKPEEGESEQKQEGATDISQAGLNFIASYEGCSLKVYKDVAGIETIGYGHVVLPREDFSKEITHKKALELLHQDADEAIRGVKSQVKVPLLQHQFDALVSFTFNVGSKALKESRLLKLINSRDMEPEKIREAFLRFRKAKINGVLTDVQGLVNRRGTEAKLFLEGVYEK
ncbi:hypothetical protein Aasi_1537 [Candidatus Amoebophilus asiaticus 5a2]|uniref:Lysozyme n=2 Tax=Candidatus Amoebophilus asiaticus TaxID=281120 RepID=C3L4H1_AMOA5|nr:hypothetical protein Aasi_1537 [Candidatus Amoebophilus asiaticus 5a2]